jgi:hypothetical protein
MLFAPRSGGVKRYLMAKRAWLAQHRDGVRHSLVVPGSATGQAEQGMMTIGALRLPFGDGYRWPTSSRAWADRLVALRPSVIEAGDPYGPGAAAIQAGARCGARPQSNTTMMPFQRDPTTLARLLASCDAFLHANPNEPFGLAVLEGLASGLPIIGMATGGVGELVDFTIGQLAPRATAADLAEAIDALWRRDLQALSLAARRRAVSRHSWTATFDRLSARYAALSGSDAFLPTCAWATSRLAPA